MNLQALLLDVYGPDNLFEYDSGGGLRKLLFSYSGLV